MNIFFKKIKYVHLKILLLVFFMFLLSSCGFLEKEDKPLKTKDFIQKKQQFEESLIPEVENKNDGIKNSLFCKSGNQKESEECLERMNIANKINSHKENACDELESKNLREKCKNKLIIYNAIIDGNPSKCEEAVNAGEKTICINNVNFNLALRNMDIKYCNMLSYEEDKKECASILNEHSN